MSVGHNRVTELPAYIADMDELQLLKVDHNPIQYPPKEVWNRKPDEDPEKEKQAVKVWLANLKEYLRQNTPRSHGYSASVHDTESGGATR